MSQELENRHPLTLVVAVGVIGAALAGAFYMMREADARVNAMQGELVEPVIPVDVYEVLPVDLPRVVSVRGFLSGVEEVVVSSQASGRVLQRRVEEGQRVVEGDVLFEIDGTLYALAVQRSEAELKRAQAQLAEARSGIAQAEAQQEAARAVLSNREVEFARIEKLYASENSPPIEYDRARVAVETAQADHAAARAALARVVDQRALAQATVEVAETAVREARVQLERCVVRSPLAGRVNRVIVEAGEYVSVMSPVAEVVRLVEMKMIVELADTKISLLDEFTFAEVRPDAGGGQVHRATLHHIAPKMDPVSRKFRVELRVENADESLLSGMYGQATLHAGDLQDVLRLPREAVFKHFGVDHCLIAVPEGEGLRARLRRVRVTAIAGHLDDLRILEGLAAGDRVIVSRRRELRSGVLVRTSRVLAGPHAGASVVAGVE